MAIVAPFSGRQDIVNYTFTTSVSMHIMQYQFKTTPARSSNMAAIRASGNRTTELRLRALLTRSSIRGWTLRRKDIPGKPDFFFAREGLAVFVDGCFFHGHARCGHIPRTNKVYWRAKIERNKRRDRKITRELKTLGYRIIRIWECHLRKRPERCLRRILCELARSSAPAG